jgi:hypothetical protein
MSNLNEYTKNMDLNNFRELYMKYKKMLRDLKKARINTGYEGGPTIDEIESLYELTYEHPNFYNNMNTIEKLITNKVKRERIDLSGKELNNAVNAAITDFYKYNGPTTKNRSNKNEVLNALKLMPPQGIYPGGTNYQAAKRSFNGYTRKINGPTKKNRNNKNAFLNELKLMPPAGVYPGGTNYRAAKTNFNSRIGKNRNYNGYGGTRKKKY